MAVLAGVWANLAAKEEATGMRPWAGQGVTPPVTKFPLPLSPQKCHSARGGGNQWAVRAVGKDTLQSAPDRERTGSLSFFDPILIIGAWLGD